MTGHRGDLRWWVVALLLVGLALVFPRQSPWLLVPGILCLLGVVVAGVAVIAAPAFLAADADDHRDADAGAGAG